MTNFTPSSPARILIVTDAWFPQVNGVVRTFSTVVDHLQHLGHTIRLITPDQFKTVPCPTYPSIRLAVLPGRRVASIIREFKPHAIHIATEGPLGFAARNFCVHHHLPFTTSYATKFPEYTYARIRLPLSAGYAAMRWFHKPSRAVMVATPSLERELRSRGFTNLVPWTRGVDTNLFKPRDKSFLTAPRPILLYVGRVAIEKNIEAFLNLPFPGSKFVVGDGPQLPALAQKYPHVHFVGMKHGEELAHYYAAADVLVFPSLTDTFGLVMLEALASGVPVAAFPVTGPLDVIGNSGVGVLHHNLATAVQQALSIAPHRCREFALQFSWQRVAELFLHNLAFFSPTPNLL
ncbi:MAG: glycosyltransferase family 1 protein [bacterium]|nr:glycosyltransferase family 1 protein [bacterium]